MIHIEKKQEINVQEYKSDEFLEPEQLQTKISSSFVNQVSSNHYNSQNPNLNPNKQSSAPSHNAKQSQNSLPMKKSTSIQKQRVVKSADVQQKMRNELILQFKISELQKICTTLTSANQKLLDKIEQLQEENDQYKSRITVLEKKVQQQEQNLREDPNEFAESLNDSRQEYQEERDQFSKEGDHSSAQNQHHHKDLPQSSFSPSDDEDTKLLEQEVVDIEKMIKEYRQQLTKAQQLNKTIKDSFSQTITSLEQQLSSTQSQLQQIHSINSELEQQLIELQEKNQSLQQEIQNYINSNTLNSSPQHYYEDPTPRNRTQSRSSQYHTPVSHRQPLPNRNFHPSYYEEDYSQPFTPFDSSVQIELQKLIQKLVKELEHERNIKKRMTEEIKRIQKDLLESEKQIMLKNKKIYSLEMNLLKGQKNHLFNQSTLLSNSQIQLNESKIHKESQYEDRSNKYSIFSPNREDQCKRNYNSPNNKQISSKIRDKYLQIQKQRTNTSSVTYNQSNRQPPVPQTSTKPKEFLTSLNPNLSQSPSLAQSKHLQTFSLMQLLNEPTITLSIKEKFHICLKLVEFYEQKIYQYKNYNLLMLENVLVTNFNKIKLSLIKIRVDQHKKSEQNQNPRMRKNSKDEIADGPEKVIWNLGFLLNSLLLDAPTKEDDLGASNSQKNILSLIDSILDNRNLAKEVFAEFRQNLEVALSQRTQ